MNAQLLSVVLSLAVFVLIAAFLIGQSDEGNLALATILTFIGALAVAEFLAANGVFFAL